MMKNFSSDMKEYIKILEDSLYDHNRDGGNIRIEYKTSEDEIKILLENPDNKQVLFIVKRDIDMIRFYIPVIPYYQSENDIPRDLRDELIYVRRQATLEFPDTERLFGQWKIDYKTSEDFYYFCLVHNDYLGQIDQATFGMIFIGLFKEIMWYYSNYQKLSEHRRK